MSMHDVPAEESAPLLETLAGARTPMLVAGAPGTGKTTALIDTAVARLDDGLDPLSLLVIAPTRLSAAAIRDELSRRAQRTFTEPVVRTWSAYAFDLIRRARVEGLLPFVERAPRLLSGPEQDTLIGNLLEGHAQGLTPGPGWPADLELAVETRGFRKELREFFDRVSELGLDPADIADYGQAAARPEWLAAARFYQEYRDLLDLGNAEAFDPAGLITRAAQLLEENPDFLHAEQDRLALLLVDDLQEATLSSTGCWRCWAATARCWPSLRRTAWSRDSAAPAPTSCTASPPATPAPTTRRSSNWAPATGWALKSPRPGAASCAASRWPPEPVAAPWSRWRPPAPGPRRRSPSRTPPWKSASSPSASCS